MKPVLQVVLLDDGTFDLMTQNEELLDDSIFTDVKQVDRRMKKLVCKMVKMIWGENNTVMSKIIRTISMAEMLACAEPYVQAEEFWTTMMFSLIPGMEKFADGEKRKYGHLCGTTQRPISFGGFSAMNLGPLDEKFS